MSHRLRKDHTHLGIGSRDATAREYGFDPLTIEIENWDHKVYYPGAQKMRVRLTGDRSTYHILGAQIVGHRKSEISKRIDINAAAIYIGLTVKDLIEIDLSYTPPLSNPWDPVQIAAQVWSKEKYRKV